MTPKQRGDVVRYLRAFREPALWSAACTAVADYLEAHVDLCPDCGEPAPCGAADCELDRKARETLERFGADYAAEGVGDGCGHSYFSEDELDAVVHAVGRLFRPVPRPEVE
jgi:hypothetical protein